MPPGSWNNGSVHTSTCSCREPKLSSQNPHNGSQWNPLPPVPKNPTPASGLQEHQALTWYMSMYTYAHTHIIHIKEKSINLNNSVNSLHPHSCATACQTDRLSRGGLHLAEGHLQGKQYPAQAANHSVESIDLWPPHDCSQRCPLPPPTPPHYGTRQHYDLLRLQVSMRSLFHSKAFFLLKVVESLLTSSCLNCYQENG